MKRSQKGFAALEALLILIILAIIGGTGWYVLRAKNSTEKTLNNAGSVNTTVTKKTVAAKTSSPSASVSSNNKYITIKEWGVRASYDGPLTLSYAVDNYGDAVFTSAEEVAVDSQCQGYGGSIHRYAPSDDVSPSGDLGLTATQAAAQSPGDYNHVGNYYYAFRHDQAACSDSPKAIQLQGDTNDAVKALVPKLETSQ